MHKEQARLDAAREAHRRDARQLKEKFNHDPIGLRELPRQQLVLKTRHIINEIMSTQRYHQFKGKRLLWENRTIISIPLTYGYRLIFAEREDGLEPLQVLSHEAYNGKRFTL